jgi:hypothetical protein
MHLPTIRALRWWRRTQLMVAPVIQKTTANT